MVDLPASQAVMPTQKTKRQWVDGEDFYVARRRAGLTPGQAAEMLQVTTRTLRNWENGSSRIPYAAYRLMRLSAGHALVDKAWDGWSIHQGVLYSPAGRGFEPYQLNYLANYMWMARQWLKERAAASADEKQTFLAARAAKTGAYEHATSAHDEASGATAPSGSRLHQNLHSVSRNMASLQEKTLRSPKFETVAVISTNFRTFGEAANDVLASEVR